MWEQFLLDIRVYGNIENSKPKCYANLLARRLMSPPSEDSSVVDSWIPWCPHGSSQGH